MGCVADIEAWPKDTRILSVRDTVSGDETFYWHTATDMISYLTDVPRLSIVGVEKTCLIFMLKGNMIVCHGSARSLNLNHYNIIEAIPLDTS